MIKSKFFMCSMPPNDDDIESSIPVLNYQELKSFVKNIAPNIIPDIGVDLNGFKGHNLIIDIMVDSTLNNLEHTNVMVNNAKNVINMLNTINDQYNLMIYNHLKQSFIDNNISFNKLSFYKGLSFNVLSKADCDLKVSLPLLDDPVKLSIIYLYRGYYPVSELEAFPYIKDIFNSMFDYTGFRSNSLFYLPILHDLYLFIVDDKYLYTAIYNYESNEYKISLVTKPYTFLTAFSLYPKLYNNSVDIVYESDLINSTNEPIDYDNTTIKDLVNEFKLKYCINNKTSLFKFKPYELITKEYLDIDI